MRGLAPGGGDGKGFVDTALVRDDRGRYHAFTSDVTHGQVEHAVADRLTGPYRLTGQGDWAGWGGELGGPSVVRLPDGGYRIYLYGHRTGQYFYSDSDDLEHWSGKRELPGLSGSVRQGTVIRETATERPGDTNPALPGYHADPDILYADGRYWMYPTEDGHPGWSGTRFPVFSSPDLVDWRNEGTALDLADVSWCDANAWAPGIVEKDGTYWLYFTACQSIGVAKADSPAGPFRDALGEPLVKKGEFGHQSIDAAAFVDDDGTPYLYFGQGGFEAARLKEDMVSFATTPENIAPPGYNEAPKVFKRAGRYYAMWSENDTRSPDYQVSYGVSDSPLGPFTKAAGGPVLSKDPGDQILGTGHNSVIQVPGRDEWYLVYHRFARPGGDGTHREVALDRLRFGADGSIPAVRPTQRGIDPVTPVRADR
ncbi:family 43 glycosylhydrolase [Streptomyces sp. SB3404]|uniref:Family 43 glycosylhydrolase n=1 Tax=Streptomyces boncukensis TaxID=2711219 RepID=A0A6G4X4E2_9ACTN|nr:family 43 glycosylhydrolase [Streptomyces boncukensis]